METFISRLDVRWRDIDANFHVLHSKYYDYAATCRMEFLTLHGPKYAGNVGSITSGPFSSGRSVLLKRDQVWRMAVSVTFKVSKAKWKFCPVEYRTWNIQERRPARSYYEHWCSLDGYAAKKAGGSTAGHPIDLWVHAKSENFHFDKREEIKMYDRNQQYNYIKNAYTGLTRRIWLLSIVMLINRRNDGAGIMTLYCPQPQITTQQGGQVVAIYGIGAVAGGFPEEERRVRVRIRNSVLYFLGSCCSY